MEPIFSQSVLLRYLLIYGIGADMFGNRLMELTVENGNIPRSWQVLDAKLHNLQGRCIV
jgi:hypothetical protein